MAFPAYLCCGVWRPVDHNGLTFSAVNGAIQGRVSVKHCCTEDPVVVLTDVQDIREVLCRQAELFIPGDEYSTSRTASFAHYTLEILYRNESDQLMRYKTRQLVASVGYEPFVDAVRQLIKTSRTKESSLVTFATVDGDIQPASVPVEQLSTFQRSTYVQPEPQNIMVRGDAVVYPEVTAQPVTSAVYTAVQIASESEYDMY
eukprot:gene22614-25620_t